MIREYRTTSKRSRMDDLARENSTLTKHTISTIEHKKSVVVDISAKTILMILLTIAAIYLGYRLLNVFILLFFAFILSSSAIPLVKWLVVRKVPKGVAIFLVYILIFSVIAGTLTLIFVPFVSETQNLLTKLPVYVNTFVSNISKLTLLGGHLDTEIVNQYLNNFVSWVTSLISGSSSTEGVKSAINTIFSVAGGFLSIVTMMFMSIYMIVDHDNFVDLVLLRIVDQEKRTRVRRLVFDVEEKLGNWLIGQLVLCFVIGALNWILLVSVGVPFALPLAVLAGLLEAIPSLGPIISAVPATLFALLSGGPAAGILVLIGCIVIQQLENAIVVPRVMANAVGLKPIVVIIAVACGFTLAGPIGALISIPITALSEIFVQFYQDLQKLKAKGIV